MGLPIGEIICKYTQQRTQLTVAHSKENKMNMRHTTDIIGNKHNTTKH